MESLRHDASFAGTPCTHAHASALGITCAVSLSILMGMAWHGMHMEWNGHGVGMWALVHSMQSVKLFAKAAATDGHQIARQHLFGQLRHVSHISITHGICCNSTSRPA